MHLPFDPQAVAGRRQALKGRLGRLEARMRKLTDFPLAFAPLGAGYAAGAYEEEVFKQGVSRREKRSGAIASILGTSTWDSDHPEFRDAFTRLVGLLDDGLTFVNQLTQVFPPVELRGIHREWTRAEAELIRGQCQLAMGLVAPDVPAVRRLNETAQKSLDEAKQHAERLAALFERLKRSPPDGPFQADGALDLAALAWGTVGRNPTSLGQAADLVRTAFAELPPIAHLDTPHAVLLLPAVTLGASTIDFDLLLRRCTELRRILDSPPTTYWIQDPDLMVARLQRALRKTHDEVERLGREFVNDAPRKHCLRSLNDAYRELSEGPLRDLGAVLVVAARATRGEVNGTYEQAVVDAVQAGDVVTELDRHGGLFAGAVDLIFRNAGAHAGFDILDDGVEATQRIIKAGREVDRRSVKLSDEQFVEVVVSLNELLVALQLTVLPWVWAAPSLGLALAEQQTALTHDDQLRLASFMAGLSGITSPRIAIGADHAVVQGSPAKTEAGGVDAAQLLTIVPTLFGLDAGIASVRVELEGLRPVTFARDELPDFDDQASLYQQARVAFFQVKWLLESGLPFGAREQAMWVTVPLTSACFHCGEQVVEGSLTVEAMQHGREALRAVLGDLGKVLPRDRSRLTRQAIAGSRTFLRALSGLIDIANGIAPDTLSMTFRREAVAAIAATHAIQQEAVKIRDRSTF
jgi:hypothetical protein